MAHVHFPVWVCTLGGLGLLVAPGMASSASLLICFFRRNLQDSKATGICWLYYDCVPKHHKMVNSEMFLTRNTILNLSSIRNCELFVGGRVFVALLAITQKLEMTQ